MADQHPLEENEKEYSMPALETSPAKTNEKPRSSILSLFGHELSFTTRCTLTTIIFNFGEFWGFCRGFHTAWVVTGSRS